MCSPHIFYVWIVSQRMVTCVWAAKVKCAASPCIFSLSSTFISSVYMSAAILVMKLHDVIKQIHRQSSSSTTELVELSLSRLLQWINLSSRSAREDWNEFSRKSSLRTCVCHLHLFTNKKKWRLRRQHRKKERESRHISSSSAVTTTTCFPWDFLTWWEYYLKASSSIELIRFRISRMDSRVTGAMTSFSSTCRPASTISIVVTPGMGKSRREEKAK